MGGLGAGGIEFKNLEEREQKAEVCLEERINILGILGVNGMLFSD